MLQKAKFLMEKVLVVDDDEDILDVVSIILTSQGYKVITEADGGKVMTRVEEDQPDLVLLDVNLDPYDGRDICVEIKRNHKLPVILFSVNIRFEHNYKNCDADDFIRKPFDIEQLEKTVNKFLS